MSKDINEIIKENLNKNEVIPESITKKKQDAFKMIQDNKRENKKNTFINKKYLSVAAIAVIAVGVVRLTLLNNNNDVSNNNIPIAQSIVQSGEEYKLKDVFSENNGIKLEALSVINDPHTIDIKFRLSADDNTRLEGFTNLSDKTNILNTFNITDDKGKSLLDEHGKDSEIVSSIKVDVDTEQSNKNEIFFYALLSSDKGDFLDIKGLTVKTNNISNTKGTWNLSFKFLSDSTSN